MPIDFGDNFQQGVAQSTPQAPKGPLRIDTGTQAQGIPGVTPGPQGATGFGALGLGIVRGVAGLQQAAESFGFEPTGTMKQMRDLTEQVARKPVAPDLGSQALAGGGEALFSALMTAPLGMAARGGLSLAALGAGGGAIGGVTRFSDRKLSPRERTLLATRGAVLGAGLGAGGGILLRSMRGERDLFNRGLEISRRLGINEVPFAARRAEGVRMLGRQSQTGPTSAGEFASKAGKAVEEKILLNPKLRDSILNQMRTKSEAAWLKFNAMVNLDAPMDMRAIFKKTEELIKDSDLLTNQVLSRVKTLNRKARAALGMGSPGAPNPKAPTPMTYADLNDQRRMLGQAFDQIEAIRSIPSEKRDELYAVIRETQKNTQRLPDVDDALAGAAFEEAMGISRQINDGRKVLREILSKKTATGVSNVQSGQAKKIDLKVLRRAYEADERIKDIIDFAQRARLPIPALAFTDEGLIRPIAQGQQIPIGVTAASGPFGQNPEPILSSLITGGRFVNESFRSPPTEGTRIGVPNIPVLDSVR